LDWKIIEIDETESTNNWISDNITGQKLTSGTVVSTQWQSKGRGQAGNSWVSNKAENLLISILFEPLQLHASKQFSLLEAVSLALTDTLTHYLKGVCIKWPNDIYVGRKKIAGILIENTLMGENILHSIIGIGLNVNQIEFPQHLPNPTSMALLGNKEFDKHLILKELLNNFTQRFAQLNAGNYDAIHNQYVNSLFALRQNQKFKVDAEIFEAQIETVEPDGELIILKQNGTKASFLFKEIAFVI
jgi:BirA family biotin operon repressor/biotin-[acetyl-CoA-carboxylase] ligase